MKIEETRILELSDYQADALRGMVISCIDGGGPVPKEALRITQAWLDAHGAELEGAAPIAAFLEVALFSLLLRAEAKIEQLEEQLSRNTDE